MTGAPEPRTAVPSGTSLPTQGRAASLKLDGLQFGRGLAAVSVVVTHAIAHPFPAAPGVTHLVGRAGVTLFFVISGFIMVITTGRGGFDPVEFMRRRLLRVAPLYYVATGITVAAVLIAPFAFKDTLFDPRQIVLSLLFVPTYAPDGSGRIDPVLRLGWTLNFEMLFYAVFACLGGLGALRRAWALTAVFVGLTIVGMLVRFDAAVPAFYTRIDTLGFVAGVWVGIAALHGRLVIPARAAWGCVLACALSFTAMAAAYAAIREVPATQLWLVATCALFVAVLVAREESIAPRLPRIAVIAGDASYSLYLFHMFAVGALTLAARKLGPAFFVPGMMAAAVASLVLGWLVWRFVETPLNAALRRWVRPRAMTRAAPPRPAPSFEG